MYYIGYDIGSSSVKAALVNVDSGKSIDVVNCPEKEMGMTALQEDWAEQNPDTWWQYVCEATQHLLSDNNLDPRDIIGVGISYQMHGLVIIGKDGNPLRNSIIWCDSRAVNIGQHALEEIGADYCQEHLLNAPGNFTAAKLGWVKKNEPILFKQIHKFMLPGDYIAFKLSGEVQTTVSGLSEGILWDFKDASISAKITDQFGIEKNTIPEIVETFGLQTTVSKTGAKATGLLEGTPILYRAGDQPNNALSLNVFNPGEVAATGGTSGVFYAVTDTLSVKESSRVNNFAHVNYSQGKKRIGKLLCINGAGIMYRWLLNNLQISSYEEMNSLAESVPTGSEGLVLLPFGNGAERMLNNINLGAQLHNLNLNIHTKAHLCRAALEGIAFSFVYGMNILKSDGINPTVIRAGNDNLFRSALFSNTVSTLISQEIEIYDTTGAIGAARACHLHTGAYDKFQEQVLDNDFLMRFSPDSNAKEYQTAYANWLNILEHSTKNS